METNWYSLKLAADEVAAGRVAECQEAFEKAFAAARGPRMMALFKSDREGGGLELFFTPECGSHARELLERWNCTPCERPTPIGLQLLVGHHEITYYLP